MSGSINDRLSTVRRRWKWVLLLPTFVVVTGYWGRWEDWGMKSFILAAVVALFLGIAIAALIVFIFGPTLTKGANPDGSDDRAR